MALLASDKAWNTQAVRPSERFAYWQDAINGVLAPRELQSASRQNFSGALLAYSLGGVSMTHGICSPLIVNRRRADIARSTKSAYYLVCPLQGALEANQSGRTATVGPGECTVVFTGEPFRLEFKHKSNALTAQLPHELIYNRVESIADRTAINLSSKTVTGKALAAFIQSLPQNRMRAQPQQARTLSQILVNLTEATLRELDDPSELGSCSSRRITGEAISDFIASHLKDPLLSPMRAARVFAVSERTIHAAMQEFGESFMAHVRQRRIDAIATELRTREASMRRISDIVFDWGFNDLSVANRAFRLHFGKSPRDYRDQAQQDMVTGGNAQK